MSFYMRKEPMINPYVGVRIVATDYKIFNEDDECLGFVRHLEIGAYGWLLIDAGKASVKDRVLERFETADVCEATQRLYVMALLGMFSLQMGTADHPRFKNT